MSPNALNILHIFWAAVKPGPTSIPVKVVLFPCPAQISSLLVVATTLVDIHFNARTNWDFKSLAIKFTGDNSHNASPAQIEANPKDITDAITESPHTFPMLGIWDTTISKSPIPIMYGLWENWHDASWPLLWKQCDCCIALKHYLHSLKSLSHVHNGSSSLPYWF